MIRRLSACLLLLAVVAIVALKYPAFAYCLCEDQVFFGADPCAHQASTEASQCDCCPPTQPCNDCVVLLSLDPGEFLWSASPFSPPREDGPPLALPVGLQDNLLPPSRPNPPAGLNRGSPPPGEATDSPLTQVLRL